MTRDDIIKLAREAGWSGLYTTYNEPTGKADWKMVKESLTVPVTMEQIFMPEIHRLVELVRADERERMATDKSKEALKLALEALEWINRINAMDYEYQQKARESLNAIYEELAEQPAQQEPVAWMQSDEVHISLWKDDYHTIPLYTSPPAQRKPLTDEEIKELYGDDDNFRMTKKYVVAFARAIEAKLRSKNT